jgi:uncharacterized RDD family membrane protein YckC
MINKPKCDFSLKVVFTIYCPKCGEKLPEESKFCTKCGAPVKLEATSETFVQRFQNDPHLQEYWIRRAIACAIDYLIVAVSASVLFLAALFPFIIANPAVLFNALSFPFAVGLLSIPYFTFAEVMYGATFGKKFLELRVVTKTGEKPSFEKALIRNISKVHGVLLLLDVIGGLLTLTGLRQKYSDGMADTTVVTGEQEAVWKC